MKEAVKQVECVVRLNISLFFNYNNFFKNLQWFGKRKTSKKFIQTLR